MRKISETVLFLMLLIGIAIGGDVFPASTLFDHILRFNNIPQVYTPITPAGSVSSVSSGRSKSR